MRGSGAIVLQASPLRIDVGELVRRPAASKQIELDAQVPGLQVPLGRVAGNGEIHAELTLESIVEGILVSGTLSGTYELECVRCVTDFSEPFDVETSEVFVYAGMPEAEEGFRVEDELIDLEPMIRDAVLLELPVNPLHDEDCKGLCATCGQDLNVAECGHKHEKTDIRWEPLSRLKEKLGGSGASSIGPREGKGE